MSPHIQVDESTTACTVLMKSAAWVFKMKISWRFPQHEADRGENFVGCRFWISTPIEAVKQDLCLENNLWSTAIILQDVSRQLLRLVKMTFSISTRISVALSASSEIAHDFSASFDQRVLKQLMPSELTPRGHRDSDMPGWITVGSWFSSCSVRHSLPLSFFLLLLSAGVCSGQSVKGQRQNFA